jgi:cytochrome c-type biogenesis protein CcmH
VSRRWWPWLALGAVVIVALVVLVVQSQPNNSPAARADRLQHELACPECQGESVADSNAVSARAIRDDIPKRIAAGESDAQIRAAYVAKYDARILTTPSNSGINIFIWLIPILALLLGAVGLGVALWRWSHTPRLDATPEDEAIVSAARAHEE